MTKLLDWLRSGGGGKRRKTSAPRHAVENISDLSGDALAAIAEYLPKTSRALLAVAMTAPPSSWRERGWKGEPSDAARAVLAASASSGGPFDTVSEMNKSELKESNLYQHWAEGRAQEEEQQKIRLQQYYGGGWEVFDFLDLEKDLASKLSDDDIGATLACIDARNNLKKLYLTRCSSLVGGGLEPLRGSAALEAINLNIDHLESSSPWGSEPKETCFSLETAFSLVGSILAADGSALQLMRVPRSWIVPGKLNKRFMEFLSGHKHALNVSREHCYFGFEGSKEDFVTAYISQQESTTEHCACGALSDGRSTYTSCADCKIIMCGDIECRTEGENALICGQCDKTVCRMCAKKTECSIKWCEMDGCDDQCDNCRYITCRIGGNDCQFCKGIVFDRLIQESTVQATEMERLRAENRELRQALEDGRN